VRGGHTGRPAVKTILLVVFSTLFVCVVARSVAVTNSSSDQEAILKIISEEVAAWNAGDATAYSRHFAPGGTFTNIYGMVFEGHEAFEKRHAESFATFFKGSTRQEKVRRIRFVTADVAIVDVDTEVKGFSKMPAGVSISADGLLRTRLQQVFVTRDNDRWIEAYHNVDVKVQPTKL
jgi:uncharacterized protein (TIGR02246 family)